MPEITNYEYIPEAMRDAKIAGLPTNLAEAKQAAQSAAGLE